MSSAGGAAGRDHGPVAEHRHVLRPVHGRQHRAALTGLCDQLPENPALFGAQADGGLVEDEETGAAGERGGQGDPLPHAAGQPADPLAAQLAGAAPSGTRRTSRRRPRRPCPGVLTVAGGAAPHREERLPDDLVDGPRVGAQQLPAASRSAHAPRRTSPADRSARSRLTFRTPSTTLSLLN
ncbi:hypothetical protein GCM10015536_49980 [Streptomyces griseomycini]|nr:hypothetical protein GCM10015536_49980 [Streptomyces griseomycini]